MFDVWIRVFRRREAITAALDRFDAAQGQIAALPFDILTAVDHRLTRQPTCQGSPIELGGKSCTDMLCTRLRIGRTATRGRRSCCTQTAGRQSNSRCCRRRLSNSKVCRSMRSAERFGALPLRLRMRRQRVWRTLACLAWSD